MSRGTLRSAEEESRRLSAIESCRLASSVGQMKEGKGWEVEVTRAMLAECLESKGDRELPNKERGEARGNNVCWLGWAA